MMSVVVASHVYISIKHHPTLADALAPGDKNLDSAEIAKLDKDRLVSFSTNLLHNYQESDSLYRQLTDGYLDLVLLSVILLLITATLNLVFVYKPPNKSPNRDAQ
jgi:hypothetical protein